MDELFINYLESRGLSKRTINYYDIYYKRIQSIMKESGNDVLTQEIVNSLLSAYPNVICRAFMQNYLRSLKNKDIDMPKMTGKKEKKLPVIIPENHIRMLREELYNKDIKWGLIFDLTYYGALRREEVLNVKPMDFNLEDIKADHDALVKILITKAKFGKQRNVYIPKLLFKGLMIYIEEKQINKDARIFDVSRERWWGIFKDVCIKLGFITHEKDRIKYMYHPHSLRHSRSTEWYKSGVDIIGIRDRLGHSDISTTMEYIHPDKEKEGKRWGEEYEKINRI